MADVTAGVGFEQADDNAADDGAGDGIQPAEDDHREDAQPYPGQFAAHAHDVRHQRPADGGSGGSNGPGPGKNLLDADAHAERSGLVIGDSAHGNSFARFAKEETEQPQHEDGDGDGPQPICAYGGAEEVDWRCGNEGREGLRHVAPNGADDGFQNTAQSDGDHNDRDNGFTNHRAQHQAFYQHAQRNGYQNGEQHPNRPCQAELSHHGKDDVGANEQKFALGKVDDIAGFINQHKAQRGQGENGAVGQAG